MARAPRAQCHSDVREMKNEEPRELEHIEADVKSHMVWSNMNRVCILHLLRNTENTEMQAEEMSFRLGLSHRTILYHLDILHDYGLVEVRKFRKKGDKLMRSVWGLRNGSRHLNNVFSKIETECDVSQLDSRIASNIPND